MKKEYGKDMPFTTKEFFEKIRLLLIDNGEMPQNLLDYALSTNTIRQIRDCEFDELPPHARDFSRELGGHT